MKASSVELKAASLSMEQFLLTASAGKRLIAKAVACHSAVQAALAAGTLVIVAGTTNGYAAEEILAKVEGGKDFSKRRFFRGITLPPSLPTDGTGRLPDESGFPGDVIVQKGEWLKGKTIFDVVDGLQEGDVIVKGANALDVSGRRAGILIGHPKAGTIGAALQAVTGRRVRLIIPVGLEKRINADLDRVAALLNAPGAQGARLLPVPGEVLTEIDAIHDLTGAKADLVAAGGVCGAEGGIWLAVQGTSEQVQKAKTLMQSLASEPPFSL